MSMKEVRGRITYGELQPGDMVFWDEQDHPEVVMKIEEESSFGIIVCLWSPVFGVVEILVKRDAVITDTARVARSEMGQA